MVAYNQFRIQVSSRRCCLGKVMCEQASITCLWNHAKPIWFISMKLKFRAQSQPQLHMLTSIARLPQHTMAISMLRRFLMPSIRKAIPLSTQTPIYVCSLARQFSSTPKPLATLMQVVKVRILSQYPFPSVNVYRAAESNSAPEKPFPQLFAMLWPQSWKASVSKSASRNPKNPIPQKGKRRVWGWVRGVWLQRTFLAKGIMFNNIPWC